MTTIFAPPLNKAELVSQWGYSPSIALLDPTCEIFSIPEVDGLIGYRKGAGCYIVFGEPVSSPEDRLLLTKAFHSFAEQNGKSIIYATTSAPFAHWALQEVCGGLIEVGEDLIIDPQNDPSLGSRGRLIRKKMNHSGQMGVTAMEYTGFDTAKESEMEKFTEAWLKGRKGSQMFLSHIHLFSDREHKRWFYAIRQGKIVGILLLNRLAALEGWLINVLMVASDAPNGTSERLVITAIEKLREEGCRYLSFGYTPIEELGEIAGFGSVSAWIARKAFKTIKKYFALDGTRSYRQKFQPRSEPSYLLFSGSKIGFREVLALVRAFNGRC